MTVSRRTKRPRHTSRRVDLSSLKEAFRDERAFPCLGIVTDEDVDSHFELDGDDLLIEVELIPQEERVTARLGFGGGPSAGIWFIPPVGTEVALIICDGDVEAGVFIVGVLSTGAVPDGITEGTTVLAAPDKVLIHDGTTGTVEPLVKKMAYAVHVHPTGVGPSGPPNNASAPASYTTVLEAK